MDNPLIQLLVGFITGFIGLAIAIPLFLGILQLFGLYTIVRERECKVFMLFGKVVGVLDEPGLHFPLAKLGIKSLIVRFFGSVLTVDRRMDQEYLRSQPVNSEEGAPMGIGVWYEMFVSDPVAFLFRNSDPRGSLSANVSNATVRCLSNMPLDKMLTGRHSMSLTVRNDVSPKSQDWGYKLGSVYIRKVHFRDTGMIRQIEEKVINRLRQVTSAIKQDGANQVSIITSTAERQAAVEFARAAAMRPNIVGSALSEISTDPVISEAMFEILETQSLLEGKAEIVMVPQGQRLLTELLAVAPPAPVPVPPQLPASSQATIMPMN
jgi:regulator of protease activity HflC (stomatin/prohibitin superfamily)